MILIPTARGALCNKPFDPGSGFGPYFRPLIWLDSSDASTLFSDTAGTILAAAGANVRCWKDKGGDSRHVSQAGAAGLGPVNTATVKNGKNALLFNGSQLLTGASASFPTGSKSRTCYTVMYHVASGIRTAWCYGSGLGGAYGHFGVNATEGVGRLGGDVVVAAATPSWQLIRSYNTAGGLINVEANNLTATGTTPATNNAVITIGSTPGYAFNFNSYICEILIYGLCHTLAERTLVVNYLKAKWAI